MSSFATQWVSEERNSILLDGEAWASFSKVESSTHQCTHSSFTKLCKNFWALNKRGVELFIKDFWKLYFQKINRLFLRFNRLFLSAVNKNNLKQIYVRSRKERIKQTNLYWFTLTPRATSSPQKPLGNPLWNQNQITNTTTKVVTLNSSRNILPLANHTKSIDLEHLKNTQHSWQHNYRNTEDWGSITYDQSITEKYTNCNPIPLSLENPKLDVNLENLKSNFPNWILKVASYLPGAYNKLYILPKVG